MLTREELQEIYRRLAEPFPPEAVERTSAAVTHKGYDTSGIKYQHIANRLNEVLGVGGFRTERTFSVREKQTRSGGVMFEVTCDLVMQLGQWANGQFVAFAEATGTGGHASSTEADAKKGAFTNGFKKTAAMFGVGWQAYAGTLDDDNTPAGDDRHDERGPRPTSATGRPASGLNSGGREAARHGQDDRRDANGAARSAPGRITNAQLGKLRELVDESGGEWPAFREQVRAQHGVNVEFSDTKLASALITELVALVRKRKANGGEHDGRGR